ncbi:MAG TPA: beta-N-acetylglucosaminidase domain-containing protein, partial [Longimicrobiales bacterium]|nr:beta-N-acetylglucosaminidase domain-containing protein [Longimicrobiales bacterium]
MTPELGIIEGFYGTPWTWQQREDATSFLGAAGYRTWFYAPKSDEWLRTRWQEPRPPEDARMLARFADHCHQLGMRFGIGLSPFEAYRAFDRTMRDALERKLAFYDELGVDDVAILFDDMRGDLPDLALRQAEMIDAARAVSAAERLFMCPTYYSDDPVLDRIFGARPDGYLEQLGAALDPAVHVFWTGEEICSREYSPGHLRRVGEQLRRKPFLWDNYPVNDTERMARYLHLRAFTGRHADIADHVAGHMINPALQPVLSRIPALTLVESYRDGADYAYGAAFRRAAARVLGE